MRTDLLAFTAGNTAALLKLQCLTKSDTFWIVTPLALQVAALKENRCPDPFAVIQAESLYVANVDVFVHDFPYR